MFARRRSPASTPPSRTPRRSAVAAGVESIIIKGSEVSFRPFDNLFAPVVASWIANDKELFWVAPATRPPLTPAKVVSWKRARCRPFLAFMNDGSLPFGYAEVNSLADDSGEMWLGHVITDPKSRGRGWGLQFIEGLVSVAFREVVGDRLVLVVFPENDIAVHCYQRAGFLIAARETRRFPGRRGVFTMLRMECKRTNTKPPPSRSGKSSRTK